MKARSIIIAALFLCCAAGASAIKVRSVDVAPGYAAVFRGSSLVSDKKHQYIAFYDADGTVPQFRMVWHDSKGWHTSQVGNRTAPFSLLAYIGKQP